MRQLDYTPLISPVTNQEMAALAGSPAKASGARVWLIVVGALIVVCALSIPLLSAHPADSGAAWTVLASMGFGFVNFLLVLGVMVGVIVLLYFAAQAHKKRMAKINAFALLNGLTFKQRIGPAGLRGMIFDNGHSRLIREVLAFPEGFEVGNYEFVTGSGKSRQTHLFMYARVALNRTLPNMVLDAKAGNFLGMTNLPDVFHSSQKLQLEGNFSEYFDLYVPKQYERDALYVFTPDVMQALIDHAKTFDIEIVDDELYMYRTGVLDLSSKQRLSEVLAVIDTISSELRQQTARYRDERVTAATAAMPLVAPGGQRLRKGVNWMVVSIVLVVVGANLIITFVPAEHSLPIVLVSGAVFWAVVIFALVRSVRRRR